MKSGKILLSIFCIALLTACAMPKKVTYFQDLEPEKSEAIARSVDIRVQPEDKILILVSTPEEALTSMFNLQLPTTMVSNSSQNRLGYTVNDRGEIDFPILGLVHVAGKTRQEIAETIKHELTSRNLLKDPIVTVEFQNLTVTVLGEVGSPGRYNIDKDHLTLIDALALAGDLTIQGRRDNVMVQRDEDGKKVIHRVDISSGPDLYASPVYYLKQNDVVYVEPTAMRKRQSTVNGNTLNTPSFWISIASFLTTFTVLLFK